MDRTDLKEWGGNKREDEDEEGDVNSYWINFGQGTILDINIRDASSTSVENLFLKLQSTKLT
jgi:hypothetical protein